MLRLMLTAHPSITITAQSSFVYKLHSYYCGLTQESDRYEFVWRKLCKTQEFKDFQLGVGEKHFQDAVFSIPEGERTYSGFLEAIYEVHMKHNGKRRWGNKTPRLAKHLSLIDQLFPGSYIIGVIRDGRAVALSYLDRQPLETNPRKKLPPLPTEKTKIDGTFRLAIVPLAIRWLESLQPLHRDIRQLQDSVYTEVYYENLVDNPERELKRVCRFIGEDFSPAMLSYYKNAFRNVPKSKRRFHVNTTKPVDKSRANRWRADLTASEVYAVELILRDDLIRCGYKLTSPRLAAEDRQLIKSLLKAYFPEVLVPKPSMIYNTENKVA
ncbi:MAG: sulfotransferase [Actinomycetia bacterium]|nr:sulfotransferase [Actinomycetes bacterium]